MTPPPPRAVPFPVEEQFGTILSAVELLLRHLSAPTVGAHAASVAPASRACLAAPHRVALRCISPSRRVALPAPQPVVLTHGQLCAPRPAAVHRHNCAAWPVKALSSWGRRGPWECADVHAARWRNCQAG
eukprot:364933-Chlamydomonas_euryale.AAC.15